MANTEWVCTAQYILIVCGEQHLLCNMFRAARVEAVLHFELYQNLCVRKYNHYYSLGYIWQVKHSIIQLQPIVKVLVLQARGST